MADWMGALPPEATCLPICRLKIPGSHDSGADCSLNTNLPVANDEDGLVAFLGRFRWVRAGIRRWAITQRLSVKEQLLAGVRYFDLRISHPPGRLWGETSDFNLVHALYGPTVKEFLTELRLFLDRHPKEVVLLDVNHVFGMCTQSRLRLKKMLVEVLGRERLCPQMDPEECSLDALWQLGYQAIVFMCQDDTGGPFWSPYLIRSPWPETNRLKKLLPFLDWMLQFDRPNNAHKFYVHQGVLTPTFCNVVLGWPSTLEKAMALQATSSISSWIASLPAAAPLNILMVDFVSPLFCSTVIQLNYPVIDSSISL